MKKGQTGEGMVLRVDYPSTGIVRTEDGSEVQVKGVLPGQKIRFRVTKKREGRCEGTCLQILERSPGECPADCPHADRCGGCSWRALSCEEQLKMKEDQIYRLFQPTVRTDAERWFEGIRRSPRYTGYRNKMEFSFGDMEKGGELQLGLHARGSFYDILTVDECRITDGDYHRILRCVLEWARETGRPYYHKGSHTGYFRHLLVRKAEHTGEILVDLVTTSQGSPDAEPELRDLVGRLLSLPAEGTFAGILHTVNDSVADTVKDEGTEILWGTDQITEEILGLKFQITPFSFFQTNSGGAEVLYNIVRTYMGSAQDKEIFDLYSGTGTIAQILAPSAGHVTGVEIVPEAVASARRSAARNGLRNCSFLCGDVLQVIGGLEKKPDMIVLDPPREGVHPKALMKILSYGVEKMIYISCKATSLVRDLGAIQMAGYQVERLCAVDLFPATPHIEVVTLLQKSNRVPDTKIRIDVDPEDYFKMITVPK